MRYAEVARETVNWVEEGLISAEQAQRIRARYRETASRERRGKIVTALSILGAIVLGLGVILFIAANWSELPKAMRLALVTGSLLAAYAGGYALAERPGRRPRLGAALYLLGGVLFGATLFLVGQMYNVEAHDPLALLIWGLGALAAGAAVRSQPLGALGIVLLGSWLMWELAISGGESVGLAAAAAALYGAALYGIGTWGRERLAPFALGAPCRVAGFIFAAVGAFAFTFVPVLEDLGEARGGALEDPKVALALAAVGILAVVGSILVALDRTRSTRIFESTAIVGLSALAALAVAVPEGSGGSPSALDGALLYPVLFNLLVVTIALGAIFVGYANEEVWLVNAGIAFVAVDLVARYLDFFWALMPRSLVFIGFGLLLLAAAAVLERQRSRLVRRIRSG